MYLVNVYHNDEMELGLDCVIKTCGIKTCFIFWINLRKEIKMYITNIYHNEDIPTPYCVIDGCVFKSCILKFW